MSRIESGPMSRAGGASAVTEGLQQATSGRRLKVQTSRQRRRFGPRHAASILLLGVLLLLGSTLVSAASGDSDKGGKDTSSKSGTSSDQQQTPPPGVVVASVQMQDVAAERRYIGTIKAIQSVDVRARVEGFLNEVAFEQGHTVEAGQLLYQIEQDQYQAALASAEGQLAASQAALSSASATLEDKQADFERFAELVKRGDTSQTNFDRAKAQRDEAAASVESAKASIKQAQAAIDTAKINLGYTTIKSPISGRIGATKYTEGNLVNASSGTLATVVQLDPIRAVFSIPSADFVRLQERLAEDGADRAQDLYVPHLILPTGTAYKESGRVAFADNQVNTSTGTIPIYADFPNPDRLLLPGQFVTAVVRTAETRKEPVVPASAIQRTREGEQVYLVGADNRVEQRTIKTGVQVGTGYAVTSGLQSGEIVIVSGVQKVKPGMVVKPIKQSEADSKASGDASSGGASSGSSDSSSSAGNASSRASGADAAASSTTAASAQSSDASGSSASSAPGSSSTADADADADATADADAGGGAAVSPAAGVDETPTGNTAADGAGDRESDGKATATSNGTGDSQ